MIYLRNIGMMSEIQQDFFPSFHYLSSQVEMDSKRSDLVRAPAFQSCSGCYMNQNGGKGCKYVVVTFQGFI